MCISTLLSHWYKCSATVWWWKDPSFQNHQSGKRWWSIRSGWWQAVRSTHANTVIYAQALLLAAQWRCCGSFFFFRFCGPGVLPWDKRLCCTRLMNCHLVLFSHSPLWSYQMSNSNQFVLVNRQSLAFFYAFFYSNTKASPVIGSQGNWCCWSAQFVASCLQWFLYSQAG